MNRFEKIVYDIVKANPRAKTLVRNLYQALFDLLPQQTEPEHHGQKLINRRGYFFGFHDHSPFSANGDYLLCCKSPQELFMPTLGDPIEIGIFKGKNWLEFEPLTLSRAWNWHKGCRLQWVRSTDQFMYNDCDNGEVVSKVFDVRSGSVTQFPDPVSSSSPDGSYFLSYDFLAVENLMPGYGYKTKSQKYLVEAKNAPLKHICLSSGVQKTLIEAGSLSDYGDTSRWGKNDFHFLTHTQISPCSKYIAFMHRWINDTSDIRNRFSRLLVCDCDGNIVAELPTNGMVSHFCWVGSNEIVAFCNTKYFGARYHKFVIDDDKNVNVQHFSSILADGHPSYNMKKQLLVTDTYPNRSRKQSLLLLDKTGGEIFQLARFHMPKKFQSPSVYQHWSVDLHPRWCDSGNFVCVDCVVDGARSLTTIEIDKKQFFK